MSVIPATKFNLGRIVVTANAAAQLAPENIIFSIARHHAGDWGDIDPHSETANNRALAEGMRILSAYNSASGVRFWIITEWDRSATTVLLPEDY